MEKPDAFRRRAQFRLWIFSYTIWPQSSKKWLSRLMICRVGKARSACARAAVVGTLRFAHPAALYQATGSLAFTGKYCASQSCRTVRTRMLLSANMK